MHISRELRELLEREVAGGASDEAASRRLAAEPELRRLLRAELLNMYARAQRALEDAVALGDVRPADLVKLLDRTVHWLRVLDEQPTDVRKHWLEEVCERAARLETGPSHARPVVNGPHTQSDETLH